MSRTSWHLLNIPAFICLLLSGAPDARADLIRVPITLQLQQSQIAPLEWKSGPIIFRDTTDQSKKVHVDPGDDLLLILRFADGQFLQVKDTSWPSREEQIRFSFSDSNKTEGSGLVRNFRWTFIPGATEGLELNPILGKWEMPNNGNAFSLNSVLEDGPLYVALTSDQFHFNGISLRLQNIFSESGWEPGAVEFTVGVPAGAISIVPEPATVLLLSLGMALLVITSRRTKCF